MKRTSNKLSIFIDESGDFGVYNYENPYYIIAMVFHHQTNDMTQFFEKFNQALNETGLRSGIVHMGPLIRREYEYKNFSAEERRRIYHRMRTFVERADLHYKNFIVEKKHLKNRLEITTKLVQQMATFIKQNLAYFNQFDKIQIYYDNGQNGVMNIISTICTILFSNAEIKVVLQKDYKLLQVADYICTMSLAELKLKHHILSPSERRILGDTREINKTLKKLKRKEFNDRNQ